MGTFQICYEYEGNEGWEKIKDGLDNSPFRKLPDEMLLKIFKNVPVEDVVLNLPSVCRRFFDVTKMTVKKKNLQLYFGNNTTFDSKPFFFPCETGLLARLISAKSVRKLRINVADYIDRNTFTSNIFSFIGPKCVEVRFDYDNPLIYVHRENPLLSNDCFYQLLAKVQTRPRVETLVYSWSTLSNGLDSGSRNWPVVQNVKNLELEFNSDRETVKARDVFETFPNIQSLSIDDNKNSDDRGFWKQHVNQGGGSHLKRLKIENFPDDVAWNELMELETLELTMSYSAENEDFVQASRRAFNALSNLKNLKVHLTNFFNEHDIMQFIGALPRKITILVLDFSVFQILNRSQALEGIANRCQNLETLVLLSFGIIGPFQIMDLYENSFKLKNLILNDSESAANLRITLNEEPSQKGSLQFKKNPSLRDINALFFW